MTPDIPTDKFDENDRRRVILAVEKRLSVTLTRVGAARKYLKDQCGCRYLVLGGKLWHGVAESIFSTEKTREGTQIVVAMQHLGELEVFSAPFKPLVENKHSLPYSNSRDQYEFHLVPARYGFVVRQVPSLHFRLLCRV
jgi:hypothetical protein